MLDNKIKRFNKILSDTSDRALFFQVERWPSGLRQRFAKPSYGWKLRIGGSNPPRSAIFCVVYVYRQSQMTVSPL